jgi:Uma2 family endonuclease
MMAAILDRPKNQKGEPIDGESTAALPERYEVINGVVVEVEPMSSYANRVANRLNAKLVIDQETRKSGETYVEMMFRIPIEGDVDRQRIPDVAYVSYERWPADRPSSYSGNPFNVVPDLAVEVVSPTDKLDDVFDKAYEYLRGGVRLVWVIMPKQQQVYVYKSRDDVRIFNATDDLDGGDVLPGFKVNVGSLFPPVAMESVPSIS